MAEYEPHPLVVALARELLDDEKLVGQHGQGVSDEQVASTFAHDATVSGLLTYAGYLGGVLEDEASGTWIVLYLDAKLLTWLVVQEAGIVLHRRMDDKTAPDGQRDVIWVKRDAFVTKGSTPPSPEKRFLQGDLIRAGEFSASLTAPALSSATGIFCEADTIGCCKKATW
jgi:hypothetical protein